MVKRQRKTFESKEIDKRWADAIEIPLVQCGLSTVEGATTLTGKEKQVLQVSGIGSHMGTVFSRVQNTSTENCRCRVEDVVETLVQEISFDASTRNKGVEHKKPILACSQTLFSLGAVWVLDPASADRPQNKPSWKRLLGDRSSDPSNSLCWLDETMTLRLHSRPPRFPNAQTFRTAMKQPTRSYNANGGIVYERSVQDETTKQPILVFAVLHKPVGLPSHATVDNGVENLLYQYQNYRNLEYASLPQRLDTETSGLLLVATHPRLASYFSKLLEQKTTKSTTSAKSTATGVQKRYRCLVALAKEETKAFLIANYVQPRAVVEHFVDAKSKAPKTFVSAQAVASMEDVDASQHKWQLCRLRILALHGGPVSEKATCELDIELLTGRTHQIRGQLTALGCPIVGDPLYGSASGSDKMALQCCALSVPLDLSIEHQIVKSSQQKRTISSNHKLAETEMVSKQQQLDFALDSAWWRM